MAETGDIRRFASTDHFASYNGTASIDVSSGDQIRHRLSRAGNRRNCHYRRVGVGMRQPHPLLAERPDHVILPADVAARGISTLGILWLPERVIAVVLDWSSGQVRR